MSDTAELNEHRAVPLLAADPEPTVETVGTGIAALDERTGGFEPGGSYLIVGTPGPAKMVAALQFLRAGLSSGERVLLLTNADEGAILGVARAWGFDFDRSWRDGAFQILGFRDDFELRAIRSVEPEEVVEELDLLVAQDVARIAVDPGSMFLAGGVKSLLGSTFLKWTRTHPATVCSTFSVDGAATSLPSSADWLIHATTGRLIVEWQAEDLYQISLLKAVPHLGDRDDATLLQLKSGTGLVTPDARPTRRGSDRPGVDENRLLLISLGGSHAADIETWARTAFTADVVAEPFEAVSLAQSEQSFGGILIYAPRTRVREAVQACRALRPLTRAAIMFTSDDPVRSKDRIDILESGADDCLSGGIDFLELELRLRQSIAAGSDPVVRSSRTEEAPRQAPPGTERGRVSREVFLSELESRADDPVRRFFCLLDVTSQAIPIERLEEVLSHHVRVDEGDLVSAGSHGCAVLLQGAREGQLGSFLTRLRSRLEELGGEEDATITIVSHPANAERIAATVRTASGASA